VRSFLADFFSVAASQARAPSFFGFPLSGQGHALLPTDDGIPSAAPSFAFFYFFLMSLQLRISAFM